MGAAPRCPEVKKILNFTWESGSTAELSGSDSVKEAGRKLAGKRDGCPTLVLLTGMSKKEQQDLKRMEKVLKSDERIALGAKFFRLVRMDGNDIGRRGPVAKLLGGRRLPRLVLVAMNGRYVKKFERSVSATRLFKAMHVAVQRDCRENLDRIVKYVRKYFNEIDSITNQKNALAKRKQKNGDRRGKLAAELKQLDLQLNKLNKKVQELLARADKKPAKKKRTASARR